MSKSYALIFFEPGQKVLMSHRRLFEKDKIRLFIGTVDAFAENSGLLKVTGYSYSQHTQANHFKKKKQASTKVVSLTSGNIIVYALPEAVDVDAAQVTFKDDGSVVLEDKKTVYLDLTE